MLLLSAEMFLDPGVVHKLSRTFLLNVRSFAGYMMLSFELDRVLSVGSFPALLCIFVCRTCGFDLHPRCTRELRHVTSAELRPTYIAHRFCHGLCGEVRAQCC